MYCLEDLKNKKYTIDLILTMETKGKHGEL